ncbi:DUF2924 domain-containing protein [Defluviimonas sp. WL0024]|uniref:DUF2924 domain-containing protein n=1 Tax=Albidovulum salinarum TaxID=2984153 RepID=A0ABT2WYH4_9RHOB|nr:DUF2924 domain-containing protein [Defluviimonas sp. WL0024]MCU9846723.1 DUF2924 domain-containing protein [Defluviimonas sp. WL0024]
MFDKDPMQSNVQARLVWRVQKRRLPSVPDIAAADRQTLIAWWRQIFGSNVPKGLSQGFLRRFLAFELQSRQHGGLPTSLLAQLRRIDLGHERRPTASLQPGARLLREWNGVTHVVEMLPRGCLWNGKSYRSLSAVARAITGAQWSGPRFFGLTDPRTVTDQNKSRRTTRPGLPVSRRAT